MSRGGGGCCGVVKASGNFSFYLLISQRNAQMISRAFTFRLTYEYVEFYMHVQGASYRLCPVEYRRRYCVFRDRGHVYGTRTLFSLFFYVPRYITDCSWISDDFKRTPLYMPSTWGQIGSPRRAHHFKPFKIRSRIFGYSDHTTRDTSHVSTSHLNPMGNDKNKNNYLIYNNII